MNSSPLSESTHATAKPAATGEERKPRNGLATRENHAREPVFGSAKDFLHNRFVYIVISARARGLSVGVNMSPTKTCSFDCAYCEVDRTQPGKEPRLEVEVMAAELEHTLQYVQSNQLFEHPVLGALPRDLLQLRHVALSGDGEPTLCPNFVEAVQAVAHVRALGRVPAFKLVLLTNGTGLDSPTIQAGLKYFAHTDEIWIKLDAGTQEYMEFVNRPKVTLQQVLANILLVGRHRPVVIQSLFAGYNGDEPPAEQIEQYAQRLHELKAAGAQMSLVQIYSAARPSHNTHCRHLPLKSLSRIAQVVRGTTGLPVEVF